MHKYVQAQLPFYAVGTLPANEQAEIEDHLAACLECQAALATWQTLAQEVHAASAERVGALPPLSPVVRASLRRRPSWLQAVQRAGVLIWAQRAVIMRNGTLPAIAVVMAIAAAVSVNSTTLAGDTLAFPFLVIIPILAALMAAFLHSPESDPAGEIVAATPLSEATLVYARLTLALAAISGMALVGSAALSARVPAQLGVLVGGWLGPMLLLSALTTILALVWKPSAAAGVSLSLWAGVVSLLTASPSNALWLIELRRICHALLQPEWWLVGVQIMAAGLLWFLGWLLLTREMLPARRQEGTR